MRRLRLLDPAPQQNSLRRVLQQALGPQSSLSWCSKMSAGTRKTASLTSFWSTQMLTASILATLSVISLTVFARGSGCARGDSSLTCMSWRLQRTDNYEEAVATRIFDQDEPYRHNFWAFVKSIGGGWSYGWKLLEQQAFERGDEPPGSIAANTRNSATGPGSPALKAATEILQYASEARGGGPLGWDLFRGRRARHDRALKKALERAESRRAKDNGGGDCQSEDGRDADNELPAGLINQGNTCYLNSLLQTMYHAPGLKSAVVEAAESGECGEGKTLAALAKVFKDLGDKGRAVSTVPLTRAMGLDPRIQQDAQEFERFLFMALEGEDSGDLGERIQKLFAGRMVNYIECVDLAHRKETKETFFDLPLDVSGSASLEKALDRFVAVELLTGENRWRAGEHGLQDARKGVHFVALPGVLQFHLKRFQYDPFVDDLSKVNDRFEFPTELDMSSWLSDKSARVSLDIEQDLSTAPIPSDNASPPNAAEEAVADSDSCAVTTNGDATSSRYSLNAVIMHVGSPSVGHYYAYIRRRHVKPSVLLNQRSESGASDESMREEEVTTTSGRKPAQWVKLDDERVREVSEEEVLRDAFGGGKATASLGGLGLSGLLGQEGMAGGGSTASAYMLQYIREETSDAAVSSRREQTPKASSQQP